MWFEPHVSGLIGGIIGGSIGVLGGIWGTMAGLFSRKGKYKKLVLSLAIVLIILGVISLCTGIIALIIRQPYHVWYPFALSGFLLTVILLPNYFNIMKTYTRSELNKMSTDDLS